MSIHTSLGWSGQEERTRPDQTGLWWAGQLTGGASGKVHVLQGALEAIEAWQMALLKNSLPVGSLPPAPPAAPHKPAQGQTGKGRKSKPQPEMDAGLLLPPLA